MDSDSQDRSTATTSSMTCAPDGPQLTSPAHPVRSGQAIELLPSTNDGGNSFSFCIKQGDTINDHNRPKLIAKRRLHCQRTGEIAPKRYIELHFSKRYTEVHFSMHWCTENFVLQISKTCPFQDTKIFQSKCTSVPCNKSSCYVFQNENKTNQHQSANVHKLTLPPVNK